MAQPKQARKVCLIMIDGWGLAPASDPGNAIAHARTPTMSMLQQRFPSTVLEASGLAVGLPDGLMGNSEVGHMNAGAGRVVYQDIVRIDMAVRSGQLAACPALVAAFDRARAGRGRVHFLGLVSDGGVHSHITHLKALLAAAKAAGIAHSYVHSFSDGRDTSPTSASAY